MLSWSSVSNSSNRCFSDSVMATSAPASVASWKAAERKQEKEKSGRGEREGAEERWAVRELREGEHRMI